MTDTFTVPSRTEPTRATLHLSRRAAFWAIALTLFVVAAFSTAPSSLYGQYGQREKSLTLTAVYAVDTVGVVASLLLVGHVSDCASPSSRT